MYLDVEDCKLLCAKKGGVISPCEIRGQSKGSVTSLAPYCSLSSQSTAAL